VGTGTFTFVTSSAVATGTYTTNNGTTIKSKNAFMGFQQSTGKFTLLTQTNNTSEVFTGTKAVLDANVDWSNIQNYSTASGFTSIGGPTSVGNFTLYSTDVTAATSTGGNIILRGGNSTGTTAATGGNTYVTAGAASAATGTRNGGSLYLDAGLGATVAGKVYIGTSNTAVSTGAGTSEVVIGTNTINVTLVPQADTSTNASLSVLFNNASNNLRTASSLTFNPSTGTLAATDFNSTSDIKFKTNVETANNATSIVTSLRGVEYNWIETGKKSSGVIAQELEQILPHLVNTDEKGDKSVNYNGIIAYLIETVKELDNRIHQLENR
jgi:hypothetical protein